MNTFTALNWLRLLAVLATFGSGLMARAAGPEQARLFSYSIQWNVSTDAPVYGEAEVKVLDYAYGIANKFEIKPGKWHRDRFPSQGCCDLNHDGLVAPRGDYLYFKWRVIATGEVFEDRVDLSSRLPQDMNNRRLYIVIFGPQLYVYVFPPEITKESDGSKITTPGRRPSSETGRLFQDTLRESDYARRHQIYPNVVKR